MLKIQKANIDDLDAIIKLYEEIKSKTSTTWDKNYPSEDLIKWDIERNGLYTLLLDNEIIAISYAGARNEENDVGYNWQLKINNRATFARFGVKPKYQRKGYGTIFLTEIFKILKQQNFDGVRILVETKNINAIKLYEKLNFTNSGSVLKKGKKYFLLEKFI